MLETAGQMSQSSKVVRVARAGTNADEEDVVAWEAWRAVRHQHKKTDKLLIGGAVWQHGPFQGRQR